MTSIIRKIGTLVAVFALAIIVAAPVSASAEGYYWGPWMVTSTSNYQGNYAYNPAHNQNQEQYIKSLMQLIAVLQAQLAALEDDDNDDNDWDWDSDTEIEVTTLSADDIDDEDATLRGEVDFNDSDYAYVWFEWGDNANDLDEETTHIKLDDDDDEDFSAIITDLDEDEKYYFRAVGEDEDGDLDKGAIKNFTSDEDNSNNDDDDDNDSDEDAPEVETGDSEDVESHSAKIFGEVDMNDFENGIVFFVYGQDESQVDDIADDFDNYNEIDEDGEDLQKIKVDGDADDSGDYSAEFWGLDDDTEYFYAMCLEYEDEDNDDTLMCGDTESFTTED